MSDSITIIPGAIVGYENRRWLITHLLDLENVLAKDEVTGATERLAIKDLMLPPSAVPVEDYQEERGDTEPFSSLTKTGRRRSAGSPSSVRSSHFRVGRSRWSPKSQARLTSTS